MSRSLFLPNCILILFLAGSAFVAPSTFAAPVWIRAEAATPEVSATPAPETAPDGQAHAAVAAKMATSLDVGARIRENLVTHQQTLRLVSMRSAIFLYP